MPQPRAALLLGMLLAWAVPSGAQEVSVPGDPGRSLYLAGTDAYLDLGTPSVLELRRFTLELWFRRDGAGVPASTGSEGAYAIPLITRGRGEEDGDHRDMNFFLGLLPATGQLVADFEEGDQGAPPGLNHPVIGATPVASGVWHHAAATYDGGVWRLYLDGILDAELVVGRSPQSRSVQHAGLGSALNSAGVPSGYFHGAMDEVRIWDVARTETQIRSTINTALTGTPPGLVARWGMDESTLAQAAGPAGSTLAGSMFGTGYSWTPNAPLDLPDPPALPTLVYPPSRAVNVPSDPLLELEIGQTQKGQVDVTFYGREISTDPPGPDFTMVLLPDTQYYTGELNGGTREMFRAQVVWAVANRVARRIAFVAQLGDCVENGDNYMNPWQWENADYAIRYLESRSATGLADGIPYSIAVGNHDQTPFGDAAGPTVFYNRYFGESRFRDRLYYGGHYGTDNDNHYSLFSASGLDFLVVSLEYDLSPDPAVLEWARNLLAAYPDRKAIVISHYLLDPGEPGNLAVPGQAILGALKDSPNLFLMACGHMSEEGRRTDRFGNRTVHTLLSDYQRRTNGGDGWLRILEFSPAAGELRVKTYTPILDRFETDEDSEFTLPVDLVRRKGWTELGTYRGVRAGRSAFHVWWDRPGGRTYEWKAVITDGARTTEGPVWRFTTRGFDPGPPHVDTVPEQSPGDRVVLGFARPNPSRGAVAVPFALPREGSVRLTVLDVSGREVAVVAEDRLPAGTYTRIWNGETRGGPAPAGIYFLRLDAGGETFTRKVLLTH